MRCPTTAIRMRSPHGRVRDEGLRGATRKSSLAPQPPGSAFPIAIALRRTLAQGYYSLARLRRDALAGVVVGIVALPLSMALAIAVGVAPQYGLYTAIVAGFVVALTGDRSTR